MATTHAQSYAARQGISSHKHLMGVVVQALIQADVAGVSFSIHPVTGANTVVINASYGLGEAVVSGMVTPDAFEVDKGTATIRKMLGSKECQIRLSPEGGTQMQDTPQTLRGIFSLSDAQVLAIAQLTNHLEELAECPVDVEWAIENDSLYCLQMRPITLPK